MVQALLLSLVSVASLTVFAQANSAETVEKSATQIVLEASEAKENTKEDVKSKTSETQTEEEDNKTDDSLKSE